MIKRVVGMYFSPSEATAKITEGITREITSRIADVCFAEIEPSFYDLMMPPVGEALRYDDETIVVMGLPAQNGQLPELSHRVLRQMQGNGAYLIGFIAYGRGGYGNALYEMYSLSEEQGFAVISAGTFVTRHAGAHRAKRRPDAVDVQQIMEFCRISADKLKRFACTDIAELRARPAPLDIQSRPRSTGGFHRVLDALSQLTREKVLHQHRDPEWFV